MGIYIKGMEMPEFGEKIIILTSSGYVEDVSGQVIDGVEAVSADMRPVVRGKWINYGDKYCPDIKCCMCGQRKPILLGNFNFNYCPKCGAKMDKEKTE